MNLQTPAMTVEAFDEFALLPENRERLLEFVAGEIHEVVSGGIAPEVGATILIYLGMYLLQNPIARVTGADGGYQIGDQRYIPDVGVVLKAKHPERGHPGYRPYPPDLAVEVLSPTDSDKVMRVKVVNYLAVGCVVWVIDPEKQQAEVYTPHQMVKVLGINDTLDGGTLLPNFSLPIKNIFED